MKLEDWHYLILRLKAAVIKIFDKGIKAIQLGKENAFSAVSAGSSSIF